MHVRSCLLAGALLWIAAAGPLRAADDAAAFAEALRAKGQFDLALEFLDKVSQSSLASDEFKQSLPYQRGVTLLGKSRREANAANRARAVELARGELEQFASANPQSPLAAESLVQLASLFRENGARALLKAGDLPAGSAARDAQWDEARKSYDDARNKLSVVEKLYTDMLAAFPKAIPAGEKELLAQRLDYRGRLAQARVYRAISLHDKAKAYASGSADANKLHQEAADELQSLHDKYSSYPIGFQARLEQGECYRALGKLKEAIGCFEDVAVPAAEVPELRQLVTAAHAGQAACYLVDKQYDMVLGKNAPWLAKARGPEGNEPEWLGLKFQVAQAARGKAELEETSAGDKRQLMTQARDLYRDASRRPNEFQRDARLALAELADSGEVVEPTTFADAYQASKDAINGMNAAKLAEAAAEQNNPEAVPELKEQAAQGYDDALEYLQKALELVDDDTPIAQLVEIRYLLSWLLWQNEDYYRSAVLADFVARRYANNPNAESAAKIALASYEQLYSRAREAGDATFEAQQLNDAAGYVTRRWPTSETAELAFGVILNFALQENRFAEAEAQIAELDEARRPLFEARLGNAMWEAQLRATVTGEQVAFDPAVVRTEAVKLMEKSLPVVAADPVAGPTLAATSLYLAQAKLESGDAAGAVALLEHPQQGALALVGTSNPVAAKPAYALEAYKTALRAYVAVTPPQIEKAVEMMNKLETAAEKNGGGDQLANVYVGIGLQLKQQIDTLRAAGKQEEAQHVTDAFATFLGKISEASDTLAFPVRQWIAQTYYNLGESVTDSAAADARTNYLTQARDTFQKLLDALREQPDLATNPNTELALQLQLGNSLRALGQHAEAITLFTSILKEREMMLDVQKAAAYTLQEYGATLAGGQPQLEKALAGGEDKNERGTPIVWGWSRLQRIAAQAARKDERWRDLFFECWVNIARTRYQMALGAQAAEREKQLKRAKEVIRSFHASYNDLGGPQRRAEFDELLKQIQRTGGEQPTGLAEIE